MAEYGHIVHPFGPLYDAHSRVLILGSLPSVRSREAMFFYGHPQNRFWPLIARLLGEAVPVSVDDKKALLLRRHVALWDTIYSCDIAGSGDASIRNAVPTDLRRVVAESEITAVFCNGQTSGRYYRQYHEPVLGIPAVVLPSTSPANAAWTPDRLAQAWQAVPDALRQT